MSLLQPFALRFRNYIMSYYYPAIARRRAVWLYNHILQTRGVLSQYVRRTLFTRGALGLRSEKPDLYKWLIARYELFDEITFRNDFEIYISPTMYDKGRQLLFRFDDKNKNKKHKIKN